MSKIKICGLSRSCDIDFANEAKPDFCGFIIGVPQSRRNVSPEMVRRLAQRLDPDVVPVGVFVNAPMDEITSLAEDGTLRCVQLHGQEDENYIMQLRRRISLPIIKAFRVSCSKDAARAEQSPADHILLDNGAGGTGKTFDWGSLEGITRPYILAGGLGPENLKAAVTWLNPWAVDLSSGVETDGKKDRKKIITAVQIVRENSAEK